MHVLSRNSKTLRVTVVSQAFSLVELSIVLVILGLLVGGILSGQALIHAAELRAVGSEHQRYLTAVYSFRDKYFALPGDIPNATRFWGDQATGTASCADAAVADGAPGTCNGNGDGIIGDGVSGGTEAYRTWQHLAMAGLIEGSYTGYATGTAPNVSLGSNIPRSRFPNGGWLLYARMGSANRIYGYTGNLMMLGAVDAMYLWNSVMAPEDAWNIDQKVDDGMPDTGKTMGGSGAGVGQCVTPPSGDYNVDPAGRIYNLTTTTLLCRLWFKLS